VKNLDSKLLNKFLGHCGDSLEGDWLLLGGTLLPAVGLNIRSTVDIDIVHLESKESKNQTLALMDIAEKLGLGVESVNQAAAYFLEKCGYKKEDLILFHKGRKARIFRPSVALYWKLKVNRMTESDLTDCLHYYNYCLGQKDKIQTSQLKMILESTAGQEMALQKRDRIKVLMDLVTI